MKNVLVTGADGFIGSHLAEMLVKEGFNVRALAQYNSFNSWGWLDHSQYASDMEIVTGDIRDAFFCQSICKDIDTIFHLAALIAIPYSYVAPQSYVDVNVQGTLNICEAAKNYSISRLIHTSTSEVYGTARYVPINEEHPLAPQSPYSASKIAADAMAMSYFYSFNVPVIVARPFNTYGPRQSARAVIPTIISQIAAGAKEIKLGDVTPTRDFNYVEDTCRGFLALAQAKEVTGETVNIGSNDEISIGDTLELIKELMKSDVEYVTDAARLRPEKSEVHRLLCDNTKIKSLSNFNSEVDMREGLRRTIEWFTDEKNLAYYKTSIYNV